MLSLSRTLAARAPGLTALLAIAAALCGQTPRPLAPKPLSTGITVHGHWIIEVKNSDGKVVAHREFENKLQNTALPQSLFAGQTVPGTWFIELFDPTAPNASFNLPCGATFEACVSVVQSGIPPSDGAFFTPTCQSSIGAPGCGNNLSVYYGPAPTSPPVQALVLNGSVQAVQTINIGAVVSGMTFCGGPIANGGGGGAAVMAQISPAACFATPYTVPNNPVIGETTVTGTNLQSPITVQAQQIVSVTVYITFQ